MATILEEIIATKQQEVSQAQAEIPLQSLQDQIKEMPRCRNFYRAMTRANQHLIHVIAEIKRASPSAGLIREDFDPRKLAEIYARAGADAISVLTDEKYFQGRLDYIGQVKDAVSLPVLRKDFIIDPYQIYQSRAAGADAVLLIAEAVPAGAIMDMMILANSLTLTVLLEVHEMDSLLQLRSMIGFPQQNYSLLGINNRNLKTMKVDIGNSLRLGAFVEDKTGLVSESGVSSRDDVKKLAAAGFEGVLIGETLMRSDDIAAKFAELFGAD